MTMNLIDAKWRAAELGLEIRYPRRTGEVLFVAPPLTRERVRQNDRRKGATRKVERLLRRSAGVRSLSLPGPSENRDIAERRLTGNTVPHASSRATGVNL
ncbi:hypothetical protein GobsT_18140 [Gemmata obscuriglobus]|uniref:Uncharacterized protein n=1 Tax=Gemmata obscuriglobus TaxID=114 RepID=A0A2Z3GZ78_9BACT|nr:hypothetical protein [Gemmata obscuriglobus]AWM39819.1 hypothetical protein C1280_24295 [Gemmata obscuriglobus]QEG27061.1 hypothetical protein GobsT_18140 [Gemmata obscuriglobus]